MLTCQSAWDTSFYKRYDVSDFRDYDPFSEPIDFGNIDFTRLNAAIFYVSNEARQKRKIAVVSYHHLLEITSSVHSEDMSEMDFFSHENPKDAKKKTPLLRAKNVGISNPFPAENLAKTSGIQYEPNKDIYVRGKWQFSYTPDGTILPAHSYLSLAEEFVNIWLNSPMHKKNLLSEKAVQLGCGTAFYGNSEYNSIPMFIATQIFQWYEKIQD